MRNAYFFVEPEVAGSLGDRSILDRSVHPPRLTKLHYQMEGWLGDQLLESFPCYIVTEDLGDELQKRHFSGFRLKPVEITTSREFDGLHPGRKIPPFYWSIPIRKSLDERGMQERRKISGEPAERSYL